MLGAHGVESTEAREFEPLLTTHTDHAAPAFEGLGKGGKGNFPQPQHALRVRRHDAPVGQRRGMQELRGAVVRQ